MTRFVGKLATGVFLLAALALSALPTEAAVAPSFKLSTKTLAVNKPSKLFVGHLQHKGLYYLLVAQPDINHKKVEGLVGGGQADANGNLVVSIKAPPKANCGRATLYAYKAKTTRLYPFRLTVSGCKAGNRGKVPPPPPPAKP